MVDLNDYQENPLIKALTDQTEILQEIVDNGDNPVVPTGSALEATQVLVKDAVLALTKPSDVQPVSLASAPLPTNAATNAALVNLLSELQLKADLTETQPVSIASAPKNYLFELAKGGIVGSMAITKFGLNGDIDVGTFPEDLWGTSGTYVQPTAARIHNFVSTSASDTMTILVRGINSNYDAQSETIIMNGLTPRPTVNSYFHIHLIQNTGSSNNVGNITGTAAVDNTVTINMLAGNNQSISSIYMVPVGYKGYIMRCRGRMTNTTANNGATIQLLNKPFGGVFQLKTQVGLNNSGSSFVELDYTNSCPFVLQAKSITKLTCSSVTSNNTVVEGEYDLILVQD